MAAPERPPVNWNANGHGRAYQKTLIYRRRARIRDLLDLGYSLSDIAIELRLSPSVICRDKLELDRWPR